MVSEEFYFGYFWSIDYKGWFKFEVFFFLIVNNIF